MLNRIQSRTRLKHLGIADTDDCVICGNFPDTRITSLATVNMFQRGYVMAEHPLYSYRTVGIGTLCNWIRDGYKASKWRKGVLMAAVAATVYLIWQTLNRGYWNHSIFNVDNTVNAVKFLVKNRSIHMLGKRISRTDREWTDKLSGFLVV